MPRHSPFRIQLTREERRALEARARKYTSPYRDVIRAKLVLLAAEGLSNDVIAAHLDTPRQIISKWRHRFFDQRLAGLDEEPRGGRPARFSPPTSSLRSSGSPVSCPRSWGSRSPGGRCPICAAKCWRAGWWRPSAARRSGAGWMPTPSGRGAIAAGSSLATPGSPNAPARFWICTRAAGTAARWAHATP